MASSPPNGEKSVIRSKIHNLMTTNSPSMTSGAKNGTWLSVIITPSKEDAKGRKTCDHDCKMKGQTERCI